MLYNNSIYSISLENVDFRCSYKLVPLPLKRVADVFKLKNKGDLNFKKVNLVGIMGDDSLKEEVLEYCMNDVKIVLDMLKCIDTELKHIYSS